jgi:hypothetical protein
MIDRARHSSAISRTLPPLLAGLLCLGLAVAQAADVVTLARADKPQTVSGDGDRELIVEGPFGLAWQSAGGRFSVQATAEGADKPSAATATEGKGQGRLKLRGEQRYRISIAASGPWTLTVTW